MKCQVILPNFPGLHTDWFQQGGASAEGGLRVGGCDSVGHFWAVELCVSQAVGLPGLLRGAPLLCCWRSAKAQGMGCRGEAGVESKLGDNTFFF